MRHYPITSNEQNGVGEAFEHTSRRTLTIDIEKYQAYLDGSGMSAERKEAFLRGYVLDCDGLCRIGLRRASAPRSLWKTP